MYSHVNESHHRGAVDLCQKLWLQSGSEPVEESEQVHAIGPERALPGISKHSLAHFFIGPLQITG